jgi:predicted nucleotidyltransferase
MFEKLLIKIGTALDKKAIPYMIIGGQAVLLYGEPRLTRDIDVTLGVDVDSLPKIMKITEGLNLKPLPSKIQDFVKKTMVFPAKDDSTGIRIDFIFSFTSYEKKAIKRAREISIKKTMVKFASPEDVIIHKIFAGRARDLDDVESILLKNPSVDLPYIRKWLSEFDKSLSEKDLLKKFEETQRAAFFQQKDKQNFV